MVGIVDASINLKLIILQIVFRIQREIKVSIVYIFHDSQISIIIIV